MFDPVSLFLTSGQSAAQDAIPSQFPSNTILPRVYAIPKTRKELNAFRTEVAGRVASLFSVITGTKNFTISRSRPDPPPDDVGWRSRPESALLVRELRSRVPEEGESANTTDGTADAGVAGAHVDEDLYIWIRACAAASLKAHCFVPGQVPTPEDICPGSKFIERIRTYVSAVESRWRGTAAGRILSLLCDDEDGARLEIRPAAAAATPRHGTRALECDIMGRNFDYDTTATLQAIVWPSGVVIEGDAEIMAAVAAFYMVARFPYISMRDMFEFVARSIMRYGCMRTAEETADFVLAVPEASEHVNTLAAKFQICEERARAVWGPEVLQ